MEHSPRPWTIEHDSDGDYAIFSGKKIVAITEFDRDEDQANAQLIAAAPELLKALKQIESRLERWKKFGPECGLKGRDADYSDLQMYAGFAIAKAEGR